MSTSPASSSPDAPPQEQRERLSLTQVLASALATVTATAALSLFGVAGTVVGAALASVLTVVGNHLYAQSIKRTQGHVLAGTAALRTRAAVVVGASHRPSSGLPDRAVQDRVETAAAAEAAGSAPHGRRVLDLGSRKRLLLTTLGVFVAILAAVTAFEVLAGKPLSDVVRRQGGSGTSIGNHVDSPAPSKDTSTPSGSSGTSTTSSSTSTTSTTSTTSSSSSSSTKLQTSTSPTSSTASSTSSTTTAPSRSQTSTSATPTGAPSSPSTTGAG